MKCRYCNRQMRIFDSTEAFGILWQCYKCPVGDEE